MKRAVTPLFSVGVVLALSLFSGARSLAGAPATRPSTFPVRIIEVRGDGATIGDETGRQLGPVIRDLHDKYFGVWFANEIQRRLALFGAGLFEKQLRPEHAAEVHALAKSINLDECDVMLGSCFMDMVPINACSTITLPAGASPDGVARFGRNLDFPGMDIADKHTVVMIYHPEGRNAFVSVSWPGIIGVLSGMNEHGLTLANMEVTRRQRAPQAMPYTILYRTILEQCRTVDEAIDLLRKTPRQTANNLMLMDASGARAVIEITPDAVTVRRANDKSALMSTNHQRGADADTPGRCDRYDCLHDTAAREFGRIDGKRLERILGQVAQGKFTLQSMVFEPANRVMYLATGVDAAHRPSYKLDLREYFAK